MSAPNDSVAYVLLRIGFLAADGLVFVHLGSRFRRWAWNYGFAVRKRLFPQFTGLASTEEGNRRGETQADIPEWLIEEMKDQALAVDATLYPTPERVQQMHRYEFPTGDGAGAVYAEIAAGLEEGPTHCFVIPWLVPGGADLGTLHHVNAVTDRASTRVVVIMTEAVRSTWRRRLPASVEVVELGLMGKRLTEEERLTVLARLLLQLGPEVIHVINSRPGWQALSRYGRALAQYSRIFASVYCDDHDEHGLPSGHITQYLPVCQSALTRILTDSRAFGGELCDRYGVDPAKFETVYFPTMNSMCPPRSRSFGGRVLWASRLARQKRPDLLAKIAEKLPEVEFLVFGEQMRELGMVDLSELERLRNVQMRGAFNGFDSLPVDEVDLYLYTSQWDGMPNVLLEAVAAGLPIVASQVGGVPELISAVTGYLVSDADDPAAYVAALRTAMGDLREARRRARAAQTLIGQRHQFDEFAEQLARLPGYFGPEAVAVEAAAECPSKAGC